MPGYRQQTLAFCEGHDYSAFARQHDAEKESSLLRAGG